jgi:hypothetical protein
MDKHKSHRPGTFEEWQQRMLVGGPKTRDEYKFYERSDFALPRTWFVPDCPLCIEEAEKKAKHEEDMRRQDEEYKLRQKEWEEAEKSKPKPAPVTCAPAPKSKPPKQTPEELEEWRVLCEREKALLRELATVRARISVIDPKYKDDQDKYTCKICNIDYAGPSANGPNAALRKRHLASTKHRRNAGLIEADVYPKHCDSCDFDGRTKHLWEQHCKSRKHFYRSHKTPEDKNIGAVIRRLSEQDIHYDEQSCVVPTTDDFSATDNGTP